MQYQCEQCGASFPRLKQLKHHQRIENHWKKFNCNICGKWFTRKDNLDRHKKNHVDPVHSLHCDDCGQSFSRLFSLNRHKAHTHQTGGSVKRPSENDPNTMVVKRLKKDLIMLAPLNTEKSMDISENQSHHTKQLVQPGCINTVIKTELESCSGFTLGSSPGSKHTESVNNTVDIKPDIKTEPIEETGYIEQIERPECNIGGTTDINFLITSTIKTESVGLGDNKGTRTCNRYDTIGLIDSKDESAGLTVENVTPDIRNQNKVNATQNSTQYVNSQLTDETCVGPITSGCTNGGTNTINLIGSNSARINKQSDTLNVDTELNTNGTTAAITTKDTSDFVDKESNGITNSVICELINEPNPKTLSDDSATKIEIETKTEEFVESERHKQNALTNTVDSIPDVVETKVNATADSPVSLPSSETTVAYNVTKSNKSTGKPIKQNQSDEFKRTMRAFHGTNHFKEKKIADNNSYSGKSKESTVVSDTDSKHKTSKNDSLYESFLIASEREYKKERKYIWENGRMRYIEREYMCDICGMRFFTHRTLKLHIIRHYYTPVQNGFKCRYCPRILTERCSRQEHERLHTNEKPFKCKLCQIAFVRKDQLRTHHLKEHSTGIQFLCDICGHSFARKGYLRNHYTLHSGERKYECNFCDKDFRKSSDLRRHLRVHQSVKCTECELKFDCKSALKKHSIIHKNKKPYQCDQCEASFDQNCNLTKHKVIHSGLKPFKCDYCKFACAHKSNFNRHMKTAHNLVP